MRIPSIFRGFLLNFRQSVTPVTPVSPNSPIVIPSPIKRDISDLVGKSYKDFSPFFPMVHESRAIVIRVYDGDTVTLGFFHHSEETPMRISCRIDGIDTPEMRGSSSYEKSLAIEARDYLYDALNGKIVTIMNPGKEKYGRVLCDLSTESIPSVSEYMLKESRFCKPYDGGAKASWD